MVLPKGLDRRVWQLAVARAVNTAGLSLVLAFLGVYIVAGRGYPAFVYGVIALIANLGQSLANAWAGSLSDQIGRRPLITWSLLVRGLVITALGTQVLLDAPMWTIAISIVLSAVLRGCFEPVAYALVADVVSPGQRIVAFGLQRMGTNLGWALGPALGGTLSLVIPYGAIFFIAAAGLFAAALLTRSIVDPIENARENPIMGAVKLPWQRRPQPALPSASIPADAEVILMRSPLWYRLQQAFADRSLRFLLAGTFLAAMLQTQMFSTLAIFMTDHVGVTKAEVGLLYSINGGLVLALQLPAMTLIRNRGIRGILPWAAILSTVGFALIGLSSFRGAALAIVVITCAEMLYAPAHQATVAELSRPGARGRMFGVIGLAQMIGIAFAPLLGGILLDTIGHHYVSLWLALALLGVGQAWCFYRFARLAPQAPSPTELTMTATSEHDEPSKSESS